MNDCEIAWAAGFFEGEGTFALRRKHNRVMLEMSVSNTDIDSLELFQKIAGTGEITTRDRSDSKPHWKTCHVWRKSGGARGSGLSLCPQRSHAVRCRCRLGAEPALPRDRHTYALAVPRAAPERLSLCLDQPT